MGEEGTVVCLGRCRPDFLSSCSEEIFALPWKFFHDFYVMYGVGYKDKQCFDNWNNVCLFDSALYEQRLLVHQMLDSSNPKRNF